MGFRDKFRATARCNFKQIFLGSYNTKEEAFYLIKSLESRGLENYV